MSFEVNEVSLIDKGRLIRSGGGTGLPSETITYEQFKAKTDSEQLAYTGYVSGWPGGGGGSVGILPHLIVISETGSTVTATKGQTVITATETSTGHFECDLTEFGTWTIHSVLNGDDAQVSLVVDTVKVYTVDDSHFHATVTVKYPDGATCRLQSADETLYATGSPYTFTVHHAETYTITVTYNQRIYTDTVTFTTEGQSFSKTLPSPSEVDVINDIDTWLWYGDVSGTFSTLSEILANSTALATLMASTDAVDYLVRCTDWASNEGLVPIMTSATTPSGEVSASGEFASSYAGWKAFDGYTSTFWATPAIQPNTHAYGTYIKYDFGNGNKKNISVAKITFNQMNYIASWSFVIQGSNDDSNWVDISNTKTSKDTEQTIICNNTNAYRYIRIYWNDTLMGSTSASAGRIAECQFYSLTQAVTENQSAMSYIGLNNYCANTLLADEDWFDGIVNSTYFASVLNVKVPTMTSNTTPSGECFGNSKYGGRDYYMAFDNNTGTDWVASSSSSGIYIGYKFASAIKCFVSELNIRFVAYSGPCKFKIQGSNDNSAWSDLSNEITITGTSITKTVFNTNDDFLYYRLYFTTPCYSDGMHFTGIWELQFYGRADV